MGRDRRERKERERGPEGRERGGAPPGAAGDPVLTDRQRAALDVRKSLSVTAGAGSGKTTVLVERYLRVLDILEAEPREVLAITFTQKAAAEMRARLIARLGARPPTDPRAERLRRDVVNAPISTIHAFCGEVLREFALEARVDPSFDVLEGSEQTTLLREEIDGLLRERSVAGDPALRLLARTFGRREVGETLERLARRRDDATRWARALAAETDDALVARWGRLPGAIEPAALLLDAGLTGDLRRLDESARMPVPDEDECARLARAVAKLAARARESAGGKAEPVTRGDLSGLGLLRADREPRGFSKVGAKSRWGKGNDDILDATRFALARVAERVAPAMKLGAEDLDRAMLPALRALAEMTTALLARYRGRKDARSLLDFDDLIARAAALLSDPARPSARARLRERFRAVLVDEFQDVDPVQWRVIQALAEDEQGRIPPERLFVVGDEKQSIYRFRGADVSIFRAVSSRVESLALDDGFRSLPELVEWSNGAFDRIFTVQQAWEARPGPLRARRERKPEEAPGEVVHVVLPKKRRGGQRLGGSGASEGDGLDEGEGLERPRFGAAPTDPSEIEEPEAVALVARREVASGRRSSDVAILLRRRTHLKEYEEALRRAGVPFVVHGGIGFYRAPEVVDATNLLNFLADARADIQLAGVLRSPLASLADGTLFLVADLRVRSKGGSASPPAEAASSVAPAGPATLWEALRAAAADPSPLDGLLPPEELRALRRAATLLAGLRRDADVRPAAELLRGAIDASGARAAYAVGPRGPQALANLEKLLDAARRFEERGFRGMARLADMLDGMVEADEAEGEADVGASDEGVRILTVHASKGLEYPVVIVPECGASVDEDVPPFLIEEIEPGRPEVALPVQDPLAEWARGRSRLGAILARRAAEKGEAEMRRLFYVACTRARDRLILVGEDGRDGSWLGWARASGAPAHRTLGPDDLDDDDAGYAGESLAPARAAARVGEAISLFAGLRPPPPEPRPERLSSRDPQRQLTMFFAPPAPPKAGRRARTAAPPPPPPAAPPPLPPLPEPPRSAVVTPSSWKLFRQSSAEFLRRATLRLPEALLHDHAPEDDDPWATRRGGDAEGRAAGRLQGTAVHRLLELARAPGDAGNREEIARLFAEEGIEDADAVEAALGRAEQALERVASSALGAEIAATGPEGRDVERAFCVSLPEGTIEGRIDLVLRPAGGRPRVVDWKTDDLGGASAGEAARAKGYEAQLELYALATARILGVPEVAGTIFFTTHGTLVERIFGPRELASIQERLGADLRRIAELGGTS